MIPRTVDGRRLHLLPAAEAWAVAVDASRTEVTERHPGKVWLALQPGRVDIIFDPDEADRPMLVSASSRGPVQVAIYADGDAVAVIPLYSPARAGDTIGIDWATPLTLMA